MNWQIFLNVQTLLCSAVIARLIILILVNFIQSINRGFQDLIKDTLAFAAAPRIPYLHPNWSS